VGDSTPLRFTWIWHSALLVGYSFSTLKTMPAQFPSNSAHAHYINISELLEIEYGDDHHHMCLMPSGPASVASRRQVRAG
jgi:hypothetical protein